MTLSEISKEVGFKSKNIPVPSMEEAKKVIAVAGRRGEEFADGFKVLLHWYRFCKPNNAKEKEVMDYIIENYVKIRKAIFRI